MSKIGVIVYLRATFDTIDSRLGNLKGRGVAIKSNQTLFDLYQERTILYEKYADAIVDLDERDISRKPFTNGFLSARLLIVTKMLQM